MPTPRHRTLPARAALGLALALLVAPDLGAAGRVILLHTNDLHGQLHPTDPPEDLGGAARRGTLVRRARERARAAGDAVLLVDAGDVNTGTYASDSAGGLLDVAAMNAMGYDAMAVGNHEFDLDEGALARFRQAAHFALLSANIRDRRLRRVFDPWVLVERAGRRVALVGLTTPRTPETSTLGRHYPVRFRDPGEELDRALRHLEGSADAVVVLSHLGHGRDARLLERFQGRFAAWIGGHSHSRESRRLPGGAAYARAGSQGRWLGRMVLEWEDGAARVTEQELLVVDADVPEDPAIAAVVPPRTAGPPVAFAEAPLRRERSAGSSSALGNFVADALRVEGEVDVAVMNRGGIRRGLPKGPLDAKQIHGVCPFRNVLHRYTLTGAQLLEVFEESASMGPGANGFFEISGARVRILPEGLEVSVGGEPLRPGGTYTLGVSDFLAAGGDGYTVFESFPEPEVVPRTPADMLTAYARRLERLVPDRTPRVRVGGRRGPPSR